MKPHTSLFSTEYKDKTLGDFTRRILLFVGSLISLNIAWFGIGFSLPLLVLKLHKYAILVLKRSRRNQCGNFDLSLEKFSLNNNVNAVVLGQIYRSTLSSFLRIGEQYLSSCFVHQKVLSLNSSEWWQHWPIHPPQNYCIPSGICQAFVMQLLGSCQASLVSLEWSMRDDKN